MSLPNVDIKELIEAGVHFGHQSRHWNPKMSKYIYGTKNKVHVIDLRQTVVMMQDALKKLEEIAANGGKFLFVGTKRQAADLVRDESEKVGQYYVNHRWLGGMLTNWKTVSASIRKMKQIEKQIENAQELKLTKKEILNLTRESEKLRMVLGGIMDLDGTPSALIVIDVPREKLAIAEANTLGIPVFAICDTNANPDGIDYIIPGNDDAFRAISVYLDLMTKAILSGFEKRVGNMEAKSSAKVEVKKAEKVEVKKEEVVATETKENKGE